MPGTNGKILHFEDLVPETRTIDIGTDHYQGFVWNGRMPRGVKAQVRQIARWLGTVTDLAADPPVIGPSEEEFNDGLTRMLCLMIPRLDPAEADLFEQPEAMDILRYLDYLAPDPSGTETEEASEGGEEDRPLAAQTPTSTTSTRKAGSARSTK